MLHVDFSSCCLPLTFIAVLRKVAFVLGELGLEYEFIYLDSEKEEHKSPEHTKYNPNGRIPTLIDHANNDFVIWFVPRLVCSVLPGDPHPYCPRESCAIMQYLVDKYDPEHRISVSGTDEKYHQLQWLFFQASGQG